MRRLLLALAVTLAATTSTACEDQHHPILEEVELPTRSSGRAPLSWLLGPWEPLFEKWKKSNQVASTPDSQNRVN